MAEGIRREIGSSEEETFVIDTENGRATHYCPLPGQKANPPQTYSFTYVPLEEPYSSLHYLAAIDYAIGNNAKIIIVDQFSFEHEGIGGYLDYHAREVERLMVAWDTKSEGKVHWPAFNKPAQDRKQLLNRLTTSSVKYFFCGFRARPKTAKGKDENGRATILDLGYAPIGGESFWYEMTVRILLYPGSAGVPIWTPSHAAEKELIKLPQYLKHLFTEEGKQLDESVGAELAKWSKGGVKELPKKSGDLAEKELTLNLIKEFLIRKWPEKTGADLKSKQRAIEVFFEKKNWKEVEAMELKDLQNRFKRMTDEIGELKAS
jgi:hypothetical protein